MTWPDWINGSFEFWGAFALLNHCRILYRDKVLRGVSKASTLFFTTWGIWNLFYYPHLGQWMSFVGGLAICLTNILWLSLMWKYRNNTV